MGYLDKAKLNANSYLKSKAKDVLDNTLGNGNENPPFPLYRQFYNNILTSATYGIPVKSYWVVTFTLKSGHPLEVANTGGGISNVMHTVMSFFGLDSKNSSKVILDSKFDALEPAKWDFKDKSKEAVHSFTSNVENTIMLVQGIKIPGEHVATNRQGMRHVGGFITPITTGKRMNFANLQITFLENNSSIADFVIRPWLIHSSYASLKFAKKATIDCYKLIPTASGFKVGKKFTFYNAVPVKIDDQEFKYSPANDYGKRQTEFCFSHYSLSDGESLEEDLMDHLKGWGYKTLGNLLDRSINTVTDVTIGSADRIITNIAGEFKDEIVHRLEKVQRKIFEFGNEFEEKVISNGNDAVHHILSDTSIDNDTVEYNTASSYKQIKVGDSKIESNGVLSSPNAHVKVAVPSERIDRGEPPSKLEERDSLPSIKHTLNVNKNDIVDRFVELAKFVKVELEGDSNIENARDIIIKELSILENDIANIDNIGTKINVEDNDNIRS